MNDSPEIIGQRLSATRQALSLNQRTFARRAGISPTALSNWEHGVRRISINEALKLCDVYGLSLDWIYRGDPSRLPGFILDKLPPALLRKS